jgi:hypothetical protein
MKRQIYIAVLAILFSALTIAQAKNTDDKAMVKGIRPMGMGGAFIAVADDQNAFFYNPAGITQRRDGFLLEIPIPNFNASINGEGIELIEFVTDNMDDLSDFDKLSGDKKTNLLNKIDKQIGKKARISLSMFNIGFISGPYKIDTNYLSWGIGFYDDIDIEFGFNNRLIPSVYYKAQVTGIVPIPFAYRFTSLSALKMPGELSVGLNIKYIYRAEAHEDDMAVVEFNDYKVPFYMGGALGFDIGTIYHYTPEWNFGMQISDLFGTSIKYKLQKINDSGSGVPRPDSYTSEIPMEFNLGAAYTPDKIYYWKDKYFETNKRWTFVADTRDMFGDTSIFESPFIKIHIGAEYRFSPFALRVGLNSGYPTFGLGIVETNVFQLSYAFYGEEMGRYAGQEPNWIHEIQMVVRIGHHDGRLFGDDVNPEELAKVKAEADEKEAKAEEKDRIAAEKKAEKERIAAEKAAEKEKLAVMTPEEKKAYLDQKAADEKAAKEAEKERIAAEKQAEKDKIAAEKQAKAEEKARIAEEKKAEKERLAAEKQALKEKAAAEKQAAKEAAEAAKAAETQAAQ